MNENEDILMKPGDLAHEAHILPSRVTYYVSLNLLRPGNLTEGGQKLYWRHESLVQLKRIEKLINRGHSLERIGELVGYGSQVKKILVIDDEPSVGELVVDVISDRMKADVQVVKDGFTAGLTLQDYFPDIIILDLNLPGINGFELCRKIREDELHYGVKILAVTGYDTKENYQRILEQGADDYLAKPFDAEELFQKIIKLLHMHKKHQKKKE